jgi:hypothetical protein
MDCCSKTTSQSTEALQSLESTIEKAMNGISGQIQGMEIGMQAIVDFGAEKDELKQALNDQNAALGQCLKVCMAALSGVNQTTGNAVKYARAYDDARMLVGTIGNVSSEVAITTIGEMSAHQRARVMGGRVEGNIALEFMK